jgi:predicted O-linked N-acetylglucosamine transferase (SPINDLY family)
MDPPGMTERFHSEELVRLPGAIAPFLSDPDSPPVNELPALSSGSFTFASLSNPAKIGENTIRVWARILSALPGSRIFLGSVNGQALRDRLANLFSREGVAPDRLAMFAQMPLSDFLALHSRIDLALDTFPYNGSTTINHALWMGVPVITLAGDRTVARAGAAMLARAGLTEFIAASDDEYVALALGLAQDLPRLNQIRQSLRSRLAADPANDPVNITRSLESAFRNMWGKWVDSAR